MKPINLTFSGLHCFEEKQVIDFDMLACKGLFGIFGPTGSGKSTILDAITLALFGRVQRSKLKTDFINTKVNKTQVELVFEMQEKSKKKIYRIERSFRIRKNGKDVETNASLFDGNTIIAEGVVPCDDKIKSIIGLSCSEFSKCIALPQGEFASFLKAKPAERIELIGSIFNLDEYGDKLWIKAKSVQDKIQGEVDIISAKIATFKDINQQSIETVEETLNLAKEKQKELLDKIKLLNDSFVEQKSLQYKQNRMKILEENAKNLLEKEYDFSQKRDFLAKCKKVESVKKIILTHDNEVEQIKKLELEKKEYEIIIPKLEAELGDCRKFVLAAEKRAETKNRSLDEIEKLKSLKSIESNILELNSKIQQKNVEIEDFKRKKSDFLVQLQQIEKDISTNNKFITTTNDAWIKSKASLDELRNLNLGSAQIVQSRLNTLLEIKKIWQEKFVFNEKEKSNLLKSYKKINASIIMQKEKETKILEQASGIVPVNSDIFEELIDLNKKIVQMEDVETKVKFFEFQIDQINKQNLDYETQIKIILEKNNELKEKLLEIEKVLTKLDLDIENERSDKETAIRDGKEFAGYNQNINFFRNQQKSVLIEKQNQIIALALVDEQIFKLKDRISENNNQIKEHKKATEFFVKKFVNINAQAKENFDVKKKNYITVFEKLKSIFDLKEKNKLTIDALNQKLIEIGTRITISSEKESEILEFLDGINQKIAECEFLILQSQNKKSFEITEKDVFEARQLEKQTFEELNKLNLNKEKLSEKRNSLVISISESTGKINTLTEQRDLIIDNINQQNQIIQNSIRGFASIDKKIEMIMSSIENYAQEFLDTRNKCSELENRIIEQKQGLGACSIALDNYKKTNMITKKELVSIQKELNVQSLVDLSQFVIESEELEKLEKQLLDFDSEKQVNKAERIELVKELSSVSNFGDCEKLKRLIEEENFKYQSVVESIGMLSAELSSSKNGMAKTDELKKEFDEKIEKLNNIKEILSVIKGKALLDFVAEEYIEEITALASDKLQILMDGRYSLKFDNRDFLVEDNFDNGKTRSASTLSGGETFVVSLCLALSISESILKMGNRSFNFFFLDEGFGTLDNDLRETVMQSLFKLEENGLTIGIITHIMDLQNEISNKVVIQRKIAQDGTISSYITIEKGL